MTPAQLYKTLRKMRAALNTLTLESISLNASISGILNIVEGGNYTIDDVREGVQPLGPNLGRFCDALEVFQALAIYLAGGDDDE